MGNLPAGYLLRKVLAVAPFALLIGIFNPLLDRAIFLYLGPTVVSGGWVSFASITVRFFLTVSAALILIASTGFNAVCPALERIGIPQVFVVQLLFLYCYIFVLMDEAARMARARSLRSFEGKGMGVRVFGSMTGHLLLRALDRAQRIHLVMLCRGFDGTLRLVRPMKIGILEVLFPLGWSAFCFHEQPAIPVCPVPFLRPCLSFPSVTTHCHQIN